MVAVLHLTPSARGRACCPQRAARLSSQHERLTRWQCCILLPSAGKQESKYKHIGGHGKTPRQGPHVLEREPPFATKNHSPQRPVSAQQPSQISGAHAVR